jgi:hypothetical protein
MSTEIRWLKWNGVYDLAGICNRSLTDLDSKTEQIRAVKERLYLLGFDCGALDNNLNDETKTALLIFNGYCDHPDINRLKGPLSVPAPPVSAPPVQPDLKEKSKAAPESASKDSPASDENVLLIPIQPVVAAPANTMVYYDEDKTIASLKELEKDEWWKDSAASKETAITGGSVLISRKSKERKGLSATLNTTKSIAVKIVSAPKFIAPFAEYAAIKLEIKEFENVKSLMFRIYRNFDAKTDSVSIAGDLIVYQEVLDYKAIRALTDQGPDDNKGSHHKAKAYILRQMTGGGMNGSFGNFIGAAYEKLHAPYKIRVWISTEKDAFKQYTREYNDEKQLPPRHKIDQGIYYLQKKTLEEIRDRRKKSLDASEQEQKALNVSEPDVNNLTTVHDKSNLEVKDKSEAVNDQWAKLIKMNSALKRSKYWTEKDESGINLIEEACKEHNLTFIRINQIQTEQFPIRFSENPVGTYLELRKRLDEKGENFSFHELFEVFQNVKRHMNLIKRRLCCGQWSHVKKSVRDDSISFMENEILPPLTKLESRQFPYDDSIHFLNCFMFFFSFIVHKAVVRPELDFYSSFGLQEKKSPGTDITYTKYLIRRRNNIDGCHSPASSEYGFSADHPLDNSENPADFFKAEGTSVFGYPKMKETISGKMKENKNRKIAKPIILPSYNPLDAYFFVKIRAVPMFMVGMLDMQYLNADGIRQIPIGFFEHDLFHVDTGRGIQQWDTLYHRLCKIIDENSNKSPLSEEQVYRLWQANIKALERCLAGFKDSAPTFKEGEKQKSAKQFALEFLLFFLLHEPADSAAIKRQLLIKDSSIEDSSAGEQARLMAQPVVPEPAFIKNRLDSSVLLKIIEDKTNKDFFGDYAKPALPHYDWATGILNFYSGNLVDL